MSTKRGWTLARIQILEESIYKFKKDVGRFPTNGEGTSALIIKSKNMEGWNGPYYSRENIVDAWGNKLKYSYPPVVSNKEFDLYSFGKNGIDNYGKLDDIGNWKLE